MDNHIHMLIEEGREPISNIIKRIGSRYVFWFNWKYSRNGHLFQDRFRSEPVESDEYFKTALLYIYKNPVRAGLCSKPVDYQWSSRSSHGKGELIDDKKLHDIVSIKEIKEGEQIETGEALLEQKIGRRQVISDDAAFELMKSICNINSATEFQEIGRKQQQRTLNELRKHGVSIRQFARLSGLSKGICERMSRLL